MEKLEIRPIDRIQQLIEWLKEHKVIRSRYAFEKLCGLSDNYIKNTLNTDIGAPSVLIIARIYKTFPDVSLEWLVTGEGRMFKSREPDVEIANKVKFHLLGQLVQDGLPISPPTAK